MRTVGVVTVSRSDYGLYRPVLRRIAGERSLRLVIYVAGMHLERAYGKTVSLVSDDGFKIAGYVPMALRGDHPAVTARAIGLGVLGFARIFRRRRPDILVVLGDRFDMVPAALAALPFKIPVAHIHGGETTEGVIDECLRHMLTKLSHLHFVSTRIHRRRVIQMGEEPWRVVVSGAPGLDNLRTLRHLSAEEVAKALGFPLEAKVLLITLHPETLRCETPAQQYQELLAALEAIEAQMVFTLPNADTGGRIGAKLIRGFVATHPCAHFVENLGTELYLNLMRHASAMVGNSSSGLIEAPSFHLPVVNIGRRQAGRMRGANVIDVRSERGSILAGIRKALTPRFRSKLSGLRNPYDAGKPAADIIVDRLVSIRLGERLITKRFHDLVNHG